VRAGLLGLVMAAAALAAASSFAAIHVVATTTDLAALTAAVGRDLVIVESIVPAGVDPEAFEPRPGDLDKLRHADIVVRIGLGYDFWLDALVARIGNERIVWGGDAYVDASAGIPLLEIRGQSVVNEGGHGHGVGNPHYWLDPEYAIIITAGIAEALARRVPEHRDKIIANRERFLAELRTRRQRWGDVLAPYAGTKFIAYHNSWPYFARRFRLDVVGYIESREGVSPSPAHLARLVSLGRKSQVKAILHEPYEPEDASRFIAQKLGVPMLKLAISVGSMPGTDDFFALFDYNVASIAKALGARNP
jgi:ABC-type Zn uptake system ZnuABC Zn-binding protein ZnuA